LLKIRRNKFMGDFAILTDSACDLPANLALDLDLSVVPLSVLIDGNTYINYLDGREINPPDFYSKLREGKMATTSAVNVDTFLTQMNDLLESGKDILYLGFSSGLSGTFSSARVAANDLAEKYPERKIFAVDTLCASLGEGMLVYLAAEEKKEGKTIEEVRDYVEETKLHLCHWFTVDDLHHLKRGGRVSAATALLGSALNIKPILHVDNEGKLVSVEKTRGRKMSINKLVQKMAETVVDSANQTIFISHGDCIEDANYLAGLIKKKIGVKNVIINHVGPVIGAHSGPGTLALFFVGKER